MKFTLDQFNETFKTANENLTVANVRENLAYIDVLVCNYVQKIVKKNLDIPITYEDESVQKDQNATTKEEVQRALRLGQELVQRLEAEAKNNPDINYFLNSKDGKELKDRVIQYGLELNQEKLHVSHTPGEWTRFAQWNDNRDKYTFSKIEPVKEEERQPGYSPGSSTK